MDLAPIRDQIDQIDRQIVEMLNQRLALAAEIGKLKRSAGGQIYVAEREDAVMRKVVALNQGPIRNEALRAIYCEIMSAAIALEKPLTIAYLGPEATNSHQAAMKKFGASVSYHALATFADIFTAVERGESDYESAHYLYALQSCGRVNSTQIFNGEEYHRDYPQTHIISDAQMSRSATTSLVSRIRSHSAVVQNS